MPILRPCQNSSFACRPPAKALRLGKENESVKLLAFDNLALNGDDMRKLPLSIQGQLQRLLARRPDGIFLSDFEQGKIGPDLFS